MGRDALDHVRVLAGMGRKIRDGQAGTDVPTIADLAMERLRASPYKAMRRVSCECKHAVLFLRGQLFSFHEKQIAQELVAGISGVTQVVNEIEME